jgi:hypothetical protein
LWFAAVVGVVEESSREEQGRGYQGAEERQFTGKLEHQGAM